MNATAPRPFPWDSVLHLAFRALRWPPDAVWRATPREIAWALSADSSAAGRPLGRAELSTLMILYPDASEG